MFPPAAPPARMVVLYEPLPLPTPETTPPVGSFLIGHTSDGREPVYALGWQLDRHLLIVGGTGCGKTTLIARLFTQEILKWE